jgi:hypothetical protein
MKIYKDKTPRQVVSKLINYKNLVIKNTNHLTVKILMIQIKMIEEIKNIHPPSVIT